MADDPMPKGDDDDTGAKKRTPVVCGFCGCTLARSGDVLKTSAEAKAYQKQDTVIEKAAEQIAALDVELAAVKEQLRLAKDAAPVPVGAGKRSGISAFMLGEDDE